APAAGPASPRRWAGSRAGDRIGVRGPPGQRVFLPLRSAVLGAEDLPAARHAVDLLGVLGVQRHAHHGGPRLHPAVHALPRAAEIVAPVERAVLAARGGAEASEEGVGIVRRYADVAGVGERREASDLHVFPGGAAVGAPEDAHAHGEEHRARRRAGHAESMAVHHALDLRVAHDAALEVGPVGELDQGLAHVLPGLAAIARAHDTVHLEPGIELARVARVGGHAGHGAVEAHLHVAGRLEPELPPGVAAVLALVDGRGRGPGVHDP